jgi:hypothetical protein
VPDCAGTPWVITVRRGGRHTNDSVPNRPRLRAAHFPAQFAPDAMKCADLPGCRPLTESWLGALLGFPRRRSEVPGPVLLLGLNGMRLESPPVTM